MKNRENDNLEEFSKHFNDSKLVDLHVHINPVDVEEINYRDISKTLLREFPSALLEYLIKHTFTEKLVKDTIKSESIIYPNYIIEAKEKGITVPSMDHDDCNIEKRHYISEQLNIPFGGEFTVDLKDGNQTHIGVLNLELEDYEKLLSLRENFDNFIEYAQKLEKKGALLFGCHPFSITNGDGIPVTSLEMFEQWPDVIEINISHKKEAAITTIASLVSGKKLIATSDSHEPSTIGKAGVVIEGDNNWRNLIEYLKGPASDDLNLYFQLEERRGVSNRIKKILKYHISNMNESLKLPKYLTNSELKILYAMIDKGVDSYYKNPKTSKNGEKILNEVKEYYNELPEKERKIIMSRFDNFLERNGYLNELKSNDDYFNEIYEFANWMKKSDELIEANKYSVQNLIPSVVPTVYKEN